jgi:transcriptional regulator with XRE-family HTH domain
MTTIAYRIGKNSVEIFAHKTGSLYEESVREFGTRLRSLRMAAGWRQQDLAEALGGIGRSTIANVESGKYPPTERLWHLLEAHIPDWAAQLRQDYLRERTAISRHDHVRLDSASAIPDGALGGPFVLESLQYVYVFGHSHSPEEIIEVRRVRAARSGADNYELRFAHDQSEAFELDQESLWGGSLAAVEVVTQDRSTAYLRRFDFGRKLRRGQRHDFAIRSWVERDPLPQTAVNFVLTIPAREVAIHLNFRDTPPIACWTFESPYDNVSDPTDSDAPSDSENGAWVDVAADGSASAYWLNPDPTRRHGLAWHW